MIVNIDLPPEIEAGLLAQAKAEGMAVSDYLQTLVRERIAQQSGDKTNSVPAYELPPEKWITQFQTWVKSNSGNSVVLPDEAMERESIYGDRGQ